MNNDLNKEAVVDEEISAIAEEKKKPDNRAEKSSGEKPHVKKSKPTQAKTGENHQAKKSKATQAQTGENHQAKKSKPTQAQTGENHQAKKSKPTQAQTGENRQAKKSKPMQVQTGENHQAKKSKPTQAQTGENHQAKKSKPTQAQTGENHQAKKSKPTQAQTGENHQAKKSKPTQAQTAQPSTTETDDSLNKPKSRKLSSAEAAAAAKKAVRNANSSDLPTESKRQNQTKKQPKHEAAETSSNIAVSEASYTERDFQESEKPEKKKRKPLMIAVPIVTALAILTAGVIASSATLGIFKAEKHEVFIATNQSNANLSSPQGKFLEGISIQGVDLGGKTMAQAKELLAVEESKLIPSINYSLTCHDKIVYLTEDDFEFEFDTVKVLNEAFEYSEYMRSILTDKGKTALKESEKKDYPITMTFAEDSIRKTCEEVAKKVNVEMQNAHVTNIDTEKEKVSDMFTFAEGVVGYNIDVDDLVTQITTLKKNDNFSADIIGQMEVVEPKTDLSDLMKNFVLISKYTTYSGNTWAGNMNMTVAMQSMTGSVIKPGEVFSFNEKTGDSNLAENGYYSAGVIVNGASADGIGGGICQAATTIYNAAIRAGMTVVEREPHTWPSVYVPVGIDSAIDYGSIDMKFRNDTDHEVYLICYMDGATLYAYIYGYRPADFDEIVVSSWFTGGSGIGFGAGASRSYYKDGKVVKTEDLPSSFYSNGGGTSYAFDEPVSNYVYERVFTDKQVTDMVKKVEEESKNQVTKSSSEEKDKDKSSADKDTDKKTDTDNSSTATNDNANSAAANVDLSVGSYEEPEAAEIAVDESAVAETVDNEAAEVVSNDITADDEASAADDESVISDDNDIIEE